MCMNIFLILMSIFLHEKDRKKETKKQRKKFKHLLNATKYWNSYYIGSVTT